MIIASAALSLSLASAVVSGALIAATDPVAVIALFRALGVPKSLTIGTAPRRCDLRAGV
jgi:NhaP-type Na+/H+ or K+/H+ antiporter